MKSERRHELQENELASALEKINKKIDPYSKPIAAAVAIGFIGMLGWGYYSTLQSENRSEATYYLMEGSIGGDSETLATVAAKYPHTPMAAWARLYQGSQKMGAGMNALFTSREEAEELLGEASVAFEEALGLSKDKLIQSRAHFGLAKIAESLGEIDDAIASYEAVMEAGESDAMIADARQKIATLSQPNAKEFLVWFNEQDFSPADPSLPPSLPSDLMLPDLPDLDFPDLEMPAADAAAASSAADAEAKSESTEPAAPSEPVKPAAEGDAEEMAPAEQPAAETEAKEEAAPEADEPAAEETSKSKPAEDKPAAEEPATEEPAVEEPAAEKTAPEAAGEAESDAVSLSAPENS